jgi:chromosome segregation ATPase
LDIARDAAEAARAHGEQNSRGAEEEVEHWRHRCESLEDELRRLEQDKSSGQGVSRTCSPYTYTDEQHEDGLPGLKAEMRSLVDELNSLSMKNDELMAQREQDAEGMDEMEAKVLEYKKKYDSIRIELRNLKGESRRWNGTHVQQRRRCSFPSRFLMTTYLLLPMGTSRISTFLLSRPPSMVCSLLLGMSIK